MARQIVFTDSSFWKYSWAHLVMSMTQSCRWVMQCHLRTRRPRASNKGLRPCPTRTEISPVSLNLLMMLCTVDDEICKAFAIWRWGTLFLKYSTIFLRTLLLLLWHSTEAVAFFFFSPSSPLFFPACSLVCLVSSIERLSLHCSPNWKKYGFDQLVSQRNWHHLLDEKLGFWGTWLPWRNVCSWLHDGRVGRVAYRVFSGSFHGGHWRYLPIRNHDNRSFADRISLCPGLSKNSENGNSCPKPHKAARHDWSSGKSGQHWDWDY